MDAVNRILYTEPRYHLPSGDEDHESGEFAAGGPQHISYAQFYSGDRLTAIENRRLFNIYLQPFLNAVYKAFESNNDINQRFYLLKLAEFNFNSIDGSPHDPIFSLGNHRGKLGQESALLGEILVARKIEFVPSSLKDNVLVPLQERQSIWTVEEGKEELVNAAVIWENLLKPFPSLYSRIEGLLEGTRGLKQGVSKLAEELPRLEQHIRIADAVTKTTMVMTLLLFGAIVIDSYIGSGMVIKR